MKWILQLLLLLSLTNAPAQPVKEDELVVLPELNHFPQFPLHRHPGSVRDCSQHWQTLQTITTTAMLASYAAFATCWQRTTADEVPDSTLCAAIAATACDIAVHAACTTIYASHPLQTNNGKACLSALKHINQLPGDTSYSNFEMKADSYTQSFYSLFEFCYDNAAQFIIDGCNIHTALSSLNNKKLLYANSGAIILCFCESFMHCCTVREAILLCNFTLDAIQKSGYAIPEKQALTTALTTVKQLLQQNSIE